MHTHTHMHKHTHIHTNPFTETPLPAYHQVEDLGSNGVADSPSLEVSLTLNQERLMMQSTSLFTGGTNMSLLVGYVRSVPRHHP